MAECRTLVVDLYVPGIIRTTAYACCNAMFYSGWTVTDRIVDFCDYQWQMRNLVRGYLIWIFKGRESAGPSKPASGNEGSTVIFPKANYLPSRKQ